MIYKQVRRRSYDLFMILFLFVSTPAWAEDPILPNSELTPGVFDSTATVDTICKKGYTATVRHVTDKQKDEVFKEYGLERSGSYEVDHLISLELGGSNDTRNLWPESYYGMWGARVKDALENRLHALVCDGKMSLRDAQLMISTDWIETYKNVIGDLK